MTSLFSLPELFQSYKSWVCKNPQLTGDFETFSKWISYFIAGRVHNSYVLSELIYSLSNLLVLFNDSIIRKSRQVGPSTTCERIKLWLTVLESSEVFFELSAQKVWGSRGKWLIITCIQVFKCVSRLLLLYHYKENVIEHPPIPHLQRTAQDLDETFETATSSSKYFVLQHTRRAIRTVSTAPPAAFRDWKPLKAGTSIECDNSQSVDRSWSNKQLLAETVYVMKPLLHLGSMGCFGVDAWKPWLLSLGLDLYSMHLYKTCDKADISVLTKQQQLQVARRTFSMLLYLFRSPFYETCSKTHIMFMLQCLSKIPLASIICNPTIEYLPFWREIYCYMWSN